MSKWISLLLFLLISLGTQGQQKYWIYLKDKMSIAGEERSIEKASIDSIFNAYLTANHIQSVVTSKWLNATSAFLKNSELEQLKDQPFVKRIDPIDRNIQILSANSSDTYQLARVLDQIKADTLISLGLNGKGIKVGIIDAGFFAANEDRYLEKIIANDQIKGYQNYIEREIVDPYSGPEKNNDNHGTRVWQALAGFDDNSFTGLANQSEFYLARTDQADKEYHGEEDYWIAALEWMHGQGVRLINSSLGYSTGFDNPEDDYKPSQVDGKTSALTRVVDMAVKEKGMTIIVSAGNDGNDGFKIISIPADAKGVIAVGSSGHRYWNKLGYSSIGPEHLNQVKPEVSCFAAGGTSFAAPVITGLVACLMQAKPDIDNAEIRDILIKSSHLYPYPNNYLGYGVPNVKKAIELLENTELKVNINPVIEASESYEIVLPKSNNIMAFHKKNSTIVIEQEKLRWSDDKVIVARHEHALYTTVASEDEVWEIKWKD
ncbi:S8 family serine peptidase [Fulvivirga lutimaris]|uniref:S8 family serine peptidase n=1 Tax=Fulvivirga lutimaris TaxID=1819566 RepID=UPI0012BBB466|nr:S8 family serine peptidase [Fulvivirga lutimaris]MTI40725.1 peptidase S8 [Fulvivirga lutimaris]